MGFKVSTKPDKSGKAVETIITVVYDNTEAERALATQALIVKWQGHARKNGIPAAATLKLSDFAPGTRHTAKPMTIEEAKALWKAEFNAADAAKRKQMVAELTA